MTQLDVLALDQDLKRVADAWGSWSRRLGRGEDLDGDPFAALPPVARQATFDAVRELSDADPLRQPLLRWIYRLMEQRINRASLAQLAWLRRHARHGLSAPESGEYTLAALVERIVQDSPRRTEWIDALASVSASASTAAGVLWERRSEIARHLRLSSPDLMESPDADLAGAAERWLEASGEILSDLGLDTWEDWYDAALAPAAAEGWPARLTPRSVADLVRSAPWLDHVAVDPGDLPAPIAPASFLRALAQLGYAWAEALAPERQPFVVAHDPYGLRSHDFGARFALWPLNRLFVRKVLEVGAPRVGDHVRATGRAVLLASRVLAARVLMRGPALEGSRAFHQAYAELVRRACGLALPEALAGVLIRIDVDDPARFAGLLAGNLASRRHVEAHDEDWFRNPRAVEALREEADLSPSPTLSPEQLTDGLPALVQLFEEIL